MTRKIESHLIPGPAGDLEALLEPPHDRQPTELMVVCHPHPLFGGTMHNKVVFRVARGLRQSGSVVLRFNFRGVGRSGGHYAHGNGEVEDARAALAWLRERFPELPYGLAGFSFGARVVLQLGCEISEATCLIIIGLPTRGADLSQLSRCTVQKTFVQSTHDEFGPRPQMEALFHTVAEPKRLVWIEAADHFFAGSLDVLEREIALL